MSADGIVPIDRPQPLGSGDLGLHARRARGLRMSISKNNTSEESAQTQDSIAMKGEASSHTSSVPLDTSPPARRTPPDNSRTEDAAHCACVAVFV